MNAKLDKFGRIIIPKKLRSAEGWGEGTQFELEMGPDGLILKATPEEADIYEENGILVFGGKMEPKFRNMDFAKLDREERIQKLMNS